MAPSIDMISPVDCVDRVYVLPRDAPETKRLNTQHDVYVKALGYLIHPRLAQRLSPQAVIADVGCGSGAMCLDWARTLPSSAHIYGLDISADQFPTAASTPHNVSFHVANAKQPFPASMKNKFDLVNLRLLVSAIEPEEWLSIARNIFEILKPGGAIQWGECNFEEAYPAARSYPTSTTQSYNELVARGLLLCKNRLPGAVTHLPKALTVGGFQDLVIDICMSDRFPEDREISARVYIDALIGILRRNLAVGGPDALATKELESMIQAAYKDVDSGAYAPHRLRIHTAFKPL